MSHLATLLLYIGYGGFFLVIFLETALPVCFFLPGDSLLLSAGILASQGNISFSLIVFLGVLAALLGGFLGYGLGRYLGVRIFSDEKKGLLNTKHKIRAERFYARFGVSAVVFGRFVPIVRTFLSTLAGVGAMPIKTFGAANAIGAVLWLLVVPSIGYFLGNRFPILVSYIPYAFALVVLLSFVPFLLHAGKKWLKQTKKI